MVYNNLSIIVAVSENNVIGKNNQLIWRISEDLKRFKSLTMGHHIIMGRKTWESIGRPLPGRVNVVVSRNSDFSAEGVTVVDSLAKAIEFAKKDSELFVVGGGELYRQALPLAKKLYITRVHKEFEGDTFFPEIDDKVWRVESEEIKKPAEKDGLTYSFINYVRID